MASGYVQRYKGKIAAALIQMVGGVILQTVSDSITATPSGTQANSVVLTGALNRVTTVATTADGVRLPLAVPGDTRTIINDGVNALQVFGSGTDTIDGVAYATGVALTAAHRCDYYCTTAGAWTSSAGTKSS